MEIKRVLFFFFLVVVTSWTAVTWLSSVPSSRDRSTAATRWPNLTAEELEPLFATKLALQGAYLPVVVIHNLHLGSVTTLPFQ